VWEISRHEDCAGDPFVGDVAAVIGAGRFVKRYHQGRRHQDRNWQKYAAQGLERGQGQLGGPHRRG